MQLSTTPCILPPIKIGDLVIEIPVLLAPLAGIADRTFRSICRRFGAGMVFSEMISAEAVGHNSAKTWNLATFRQEERPIGLQLFSHDPETLAQAATQLEELDPDAFDLNFGCPVRKVVRRGAGAGFLEDLERLSTAVRWVVQSTKRPVTVKLRSGPTHDRLNAVEAARRAQDEGASAVTVHARTASQVFRGRANWDIIAKVKESVSIPVIGNGDVQCPADVISMRDQTGCDAVMIGRGCLGNPWIFAECKTALCGESWIAPQPSQRWAVIEEHLLNVFADKGDFVGVREMRKHLGWYSRGMPGAAQFRAEVFHMENPDDVIETCRQFFINQEQEPTCG